MTIRINALPEATNPAASSFLAVDGATTEKATLQKVVDAGAPVASEAEARAGSDNAKRMTALRVKQSIDEEIGNTIASAASGALANTAVQPGDLGDSAGLDIGTTAGTVAAGDDERFTLLGDAVETIVATVYPTRNEDFFVDPTGGTVDSVTIPGGYTLGLVNSVSVNGVEVDGWSAADGATVSGLEIGEDDLLAGETTVWVRVRVGATLGDSTAAFDVRYISRGLDTIGRGGNYLGVGQQADFDGNGRGGIVIGAGHEDRGTGAYLMADGLSNWASLINGKDENPQELIIYNSSGEGYATTVVGTGTITREWGTPFKASWIGKIFYFLRKRFRVETVADGDTLTLTEVNGDAVSFALEETEAYNFCYTTGTGTCNVVGDRLHWVSGDPFVYHLLDFNDHHFDLDGDAVTVAEVISPKEIRLSSALPDAEGVDFAWRGIVFDQLSTLRVQAILGENEENVILTTIAGQEFFGRHHALRSGWAGAYGRNRPIYIGSGLYSPGVPRDQIGVYPEDGVHGGYVALGGVQGLEALRVYNPIGSVGAENKNMLAIPHTPAGSAPTLRAEGVDADIDLRLEPRGNGLVDIVGTHSSTGDAPVNGYLMISVNGVPTKIATVA